MPQVEEKLALACQAFDLLDQHLVEHGLSEWTMAHRLAVYLEPLFPGFSVDCEYNRNTAPPLARSKQAFGVGVRPDIIVHRRGGTGPADNLLVVQTKRSAAGEEAGFAHLASTMEDPDLLYAYGALVTFPAVAGLPTEIQWV